MPRTNRDVTIILVLSKDFPRWAEPAAFKKAEASDIVIVQGIWMFCHGGSAVLLPGNGPQHVGDELEDLSSTVGTVGISSSPYRF